MTQELWMWEYEGKTEWGFDAGGTGDCLFFFSDDPHHHKCIRTKNEITNLRRAQVNPADAVVINSADFEKLIAIIECAQSFDSRVERRSPLDEYATALWGHLKFVSTPPEPKKTLLTREERKKIYHHINHWQQFPWALVIENDWQTAFHGHGYSPYAEDWQHVLNPKVEETVAIKVILLPKFPFQFSIYKITSEGEQHLNTVTLNNLKDPIAPASWEFLVSSLALTLNNEANRELFTGIPKVEEPTGFERSDYIINVPSEMANKGFQITIISKGEK